MEALWIALGVLLILILLAYNNMIRLKTRATASFSDIDTQLKKRYDLIPNLVEVAKGYMAHEKDIFTRVADLRSRAMNTKDIQNRGAAEYNISSALNNFFILAENYPDLKAAPQFISLQANLSKAEDDISHARRYYNAVVRDYNTLIHQFPVSLLANITGFRSFPFFTMEAEERTLPNVTIS